MDLSELVDPPAIGRRRPFDNKGFGFRDAILWEHVVGLGSMHPGAQIALISNDAAAFSSSTKSEIHPDLKTDLIARNIGAAVSHHLAISAYLDSQGIDNPRLFVQVLETAKNQQDFLGATAGVLLLHKELPMPVSWARLRIANAINTGTAQSGFRVHQSKALNLCWYIS